jgi:uncharacterized membrane protein
MRAAAVAAGFAILYHPPTAVPFLLAFAWLLVRRRDAPPALILAGFVALLFVLARFQAGGAERPPLFERIEPGIEPLLRLRGSYVWVSMWARHWLWHYLFLFAFCAFALRRWRREFTAPLRTLFTSYAAYGLASIGLSYLVLEGFGWSFATAFQPARAAAFLTLAAILISASTGLLAASQGRLARGALWLSVSYAAVLSHNALAVLLPDIRNPLIAKRLVLLVSFAMLAALAARSTRWRLPVLAAAILAPFLLIATWGEVRNYPALDWEPVDELAAWARQSTPPAAVFCFPDSAREPYPSIFRAKALRGVYVDWKGGGQVNMVPRFGHEWSRRWNLVTSQPFQPAQIPLLAAEGVGWLVTKTELPQYKPAWTNRRYFVYQLPQ